jgi:hypothetical protein
MSAKLGTYEFTAHIGPPPMLPRSLVEPFSRPGANGTGAKIHGAQAPESVIQLVAHGLVANRISTQHGYRTLVGTVQTLILGGHNYNTSSGFDFLVLDVEVVESRVIPAFIGLTFLGAQVTYAPAGRIVSQWRLQAVPLT